MKIKNEQIKNYPFPIKLGLKHFLKGLEEGDLHVNTCIHESCIKNINLFNQLSFNYESSYYHDESSISNALKFLIENINLEPGSKVLDVGYGNNLAVGKTFNEKGIKTYGIDCQNDESRRDEIIVIPKFYKTIDNVETYCGTIEELLHPESELKNHKFDLLSFWGVYSFGSGMNFGSEWKEFRIMKKHPKLFDNNDYERINDLIEEEEDKMLSDCVKALKPNGGFLFVSSRYAFHGGGSDINGFQEEINGYGKIINKLENLGAKEVYLFGVSANELIKQFDEFNNYLESLNLPSKIIVKSQYGWNQFTSDYFKRGVIRHVNKLKEQASLRPIGRLDAVYIEF